MRFFIYFEMPFESGKFLRLMQLYGMSLIRNVYTVNPLIVACIPLKAGLL